MTTLETIQQLVMKIGELESIDPDADIYRAGIESLDGMDLMVDLENQFGIRLSDDEFLSARTCKALESLVNRSRKA